MFLNRSNGTRCVVREPKTRNFRIQHLKAQRPDSEKRKNQTYIANKLSICYI